VPRCASAPPPHCYLPPRRIERATALLRDTDLPITEIAFQTGWQSLGTFGRTFRDVVGETPGVILSRQRPLSHSLAHVPACVVSAAHRPNLTSADSEKRDGTGTTENRANQERRQHDSRRRNDRSLRARSGRSARVLREARVSRPHGRTKR